MCLATTFRRRDAFAAASMPRLNAHAKRHDQAREREKKGDTRMTPSQTRYRMVAVASDGLKPVRDNQSGRATEEPQSSLCAASSQYCQSVCQLSVNQSINHNARSALHIPQMCVLPPLLPTKTQVLRPKTWTSSRELSCLRQCLCAAPPATSMDCVYTSPHLYQQLPSF